jgi:hypothetical protein
MKIGFIGNIANNMYLMAGCFRALGHEANYYHLPADFMFSQPFWEDQDLFVSYEQLHDPALMARFRRAWTKPDWVTERPVSPGRGRLGRYLAASRWLSWPQLADIRSFRELACNLYPFFQKELRSCDWVMACGITGLLACAQAGVPYVFWPHGQDLRDATGQKESLRQPGTIALVRRAAHDALLAGSHGSDMNLLLKKICPSERVTIIPFLVNSEIYRPGPMESNFSFLPKEINEILEKRNRLLLFMPSRLSDHWKGTGRFISAYLETVRRYPGKLFLITSGWGPDFAKYQELIRTNKTARQSIYCLSGALSKGFLRRLLNSVDVVADQFNLGWYGTSFVEAASLGKMVLIHLDRERWREHVAGLAFPPVREYRTREQLVAVLGDLAQGKIDYRAEGRQMHDWAWHNHGMQRWVPHLARQVQEALTA